MTIELAPHQISAVERALELLHARGGVILADEPGLGKSFVAASVAARAAGHVEFIVPAGLLAQWRTTLDAFGVDAPITTHDRIVNEPFAPRVDGSRLIVADEAHAFRNPQTQRYAALARRSIGARLMLVTATPVCNSSDDLHALVRLIAPDDALRGEGVGSIEEAFRLRRDDELAIVLREFVIRRGRDALDERWRFGGVQRRVVWHDVPAAPIDALTFPLVGGHVSLLRNVLWRRLESSAAALIESVKRQVRFYQRALDCLASGLNLTKRDYRNAFGGDEADAFQEVLFWEMFAGRAAQTDAAAIRGELRRLAELRAEVERAPRAKADALASVCASTTEPMLIFTSAIATANDVFASITRLRRTAIITSHGAVPANAIEAFCRGKVDVLVSTDIAAEGLNLQRAGAVVHYDIPWNPVRIDQRNGRAVRIGQTRDAVEVIYFLPRGRRTRVVRAVANKNRERRRLFGGAPPPPPASLTALPQHLGRSSAAVALLDALRRRGVAPPAGMARRYRAGIERLLAEMAVEYLDARRVSDLTLLLERERIIGHGAFSGPFDR